MDAATPRTATMLELVWEAGSKAASPDSVVASVAGALRRGEARLSGNFRGMPLEGVLAGVG